MEGLSHKGLCHFFLLFSFLFLMWPLPQLLSLTFVLPWAQWIRQLLLNSALLSPGVSERSLDPTQLIQLIKSLTSNKPGGSHLVLFLPPYLFTSLASEFNHLSLAATFSLSFLFFHPLWYNIFSTCFVSFIFSPGLSHIVLFSHVLAAQCRTSAVCSDSQYHGFSLTAQPWSCTFLKSRRPTAPWILSTLNNYSMSSQLIIHLAI